MLTVPDSHCHCAFYIQSNWNPLRAIPALPVLFLVLSANSFPDLEDTLPNIRQVSLIPFDSPNLANIFHL